VIPVTLVTGFLGSGKTTLLRRVLASPGVRNVALIVNEAAELGIDQKLLAPFSDEMQLLRNGCVCCSVREDFRNSLLALLERSGRPPIEHVVIETTGLADPVPILDTFASDPMLRFHFRIGSVVTVVDCVNARAHMGGFRESLNQVAAADRIVLAKTDLSDAATAADVAAEIARINPVAEIFLASVSDEALACALLRSPADAPDQVARFLRLLDAGKTGEGLRARPIGSEPPAFASFCIAEESAFDWSAFAVWLTMLLHAHGDKVLRVKGILNMAGSDTPLLVNGVRHLIHRPEHLERWPDSDRRSVLAFIVAGLDPATIERSFAAFVRPSP